MSAGVILLSRISIFQQQSVKLSRLSGVDPLLWYFLGAIVFELVGIVCWGHTVVRMLYPSATVCQVVSSFGSQLPIGFLDGSVNCMLSLWDFLLGSQCCQNVVFQQQTVKMSLGS